MHSEGIHLDLQGARIWAVQGEGEVVAVKLIESSGERLAVTQG